MYHHHGAHLDSVDGKTGVRFAVWAPNASEVCVISEGNGWQHGQDHLNSSDSGVWAGFVVGMEEGATYKYSIRTQAGEVIDKADPYAFAAELRPNTASIVRNLDNYSWQDNDWMSRRPETDWLHAPVSVYEVHLASWKRPTDGREYFTYRELAHQLVDYAHEMGYTHLQLMPINEYPYDGSWGYQVTGYFAPTSRYGEPEDFMYFVDYCHQKGIGVLLDWVPAHFPVDAHGLAAFDGTCLYEHSDPRQGFHPDWGTHVFNYGRQEVCEFLMSSAAFWADVYHVDGIRVDAVASMLYLDYSHGGRENLEAITFLKDMNTALHRDFPGILTIAEESTSWGGVSRPVYTGGLGFSMKWDMGWMNDTLRYMRLDPVHRAHHQNDLSFRMIYAFTENFMLPLSHDEVVHGKKALISQMPGDYWQQFANLRLLLGYQYTMPGKKLLFMGGEFAQWDEWNCNEELDWKLFGHEKHDGIRRFVGDLNRIYRDTPAMYENDFESDGFEWLQCDDSKNSVFAFIRYSKNRKKQIVVVGNFTPVPRDDYRVGVPDEGFYTEILNSDSSIYGGTNVGNMGGVKSQPIVAHGRPHSISLQLAPLAIHAFEI
ncbi:UNVERIFIED_CONTAM: hypothetical protein GTU68_044009 [Idotea baltica]|nr:hypothetical protein [Idotea baltica]